MGLRKKITDQFGVPKDLTMGAAVLTVTGRSEAYVENYRGIIEYTDQKIRLHDHHGRQIQHLLLPAGEGRDVPVKPVFNAEERGHLGHAPPDDRRLIAEAFQPECQLVPDLVGHELVVDILLHEADPPAAVRLRKAFQRLSVQQNLSQPFAVRRDGGLELPQQRALSTAGRPHQTDKFPTFHLQINLIKSMGNLVIFHFCKTFGNIFQF